MKTYGEASFKHLFHFYKFQAKEREFAFDLTQDEFRTLTKQDCFYCGVEPAIIHKRLISNGEYICNGVDRLDNSIGYTTNNCVPCCTRCNMMKKCMSLDEFVASCQKISDYQNKRLEESRRL